MVFTTRFTRNPRPTQQQHPSGGQVSGGDVSDNRLTTDPMHGVWQDTAPAIAFIDDVPELADMKRASGRAGRGA